MGSNKNLFLLFLLSQIYCLNSEYIVYKKSQDNGVQMAFIK